MAGLVFIGMLHRITDRLDEHDKIPALVPDEDQGTVLST